MRPPFLNANSLNPDETERNRPKVWAPAVGTKVLFRKPRDRGFLLGALTNWCMAGAPQRIAEDVVASATTIEMVGFRFCELVAAMSEGIQALQRYMHVVLPHSDVLD